MSIKRISHILLVLLCSFAVFCVKKPVEGDIVFSDEFTDSTLSQWNVFDSDNITISDGKMILRDHCGVIAPTTASYEDYTVEIRSKITRQLSGFWAYGIQFRIQNVEVDPHEGSNYSFQYDPGQNGLRLARNPGDHLIVPDKEIPLDTLWHLLKVKVFGDSIECYVDGELLIGGKDTTYTKGAVGLSVWNGLDAEFDWIKIRKIVWE